MSQLIPSQALTVNEGYSFSQEDPIRLGIPVTRHFDNGKTSPSRPHVAPTIPIGAAHISFSGQHRIVQASDRPAQSCPWWPPATDRLDQHSQRVLARGLIKGPRGPASPYASFSCYEPNGKTNFGPCWKGFIQSELSRGAHKPSSC